MLTEPLIQGEIDYAALGMNFEHVSCMLYHIIHAITFISSLPISIISIFKIKLIKYNMKKIMTSVYIMAIRYIFSMFL